MAKSLITRHQIETLVNLKLNDESEKRLKSELTDLFTDQSVDFNSDEFKKNFQDILDAFNAVFRKAELDPIDLMPNQDGWYKLGELARDKFFDAWKSVAGKGGMNFSFDSLQLDKMVGALGEIEKKMDAIASKSGGSNAKKILKNLNEVDAAIQRQAVSQKALDGVLSKRAMKMPKTASASDEDAAKWIGGFLDEYKASVTNKDPWEVQYKNMLQFARAYESYSKKLNSEQLVNFEGMFEGISSAYKQILERVPDAKASLQDIVYRINGEESVDDRNRPWAREKTLQEVRNILKGGLKVSADGGGGDVSNNNPPKNEPPKNEPRTNIPKPTETNDVLLQLMHQLASVNNVGDTKGIEDTQAKILSQFDDDIGIAIERLLVKFADTDLKEQDIKDTYKELRSYKNSQDVITGDGANINETILQNILEQYFDSSKLYYSIADDKDYSKDGKRALYNLQSFFGDFFAQEDIFDPNIINGDFDEQFLGKVKEASVEERANLIESAKKILLSALQLQIQPEVVDPIDAPEEVTGGQKTVKVPVETTEGGRPESGRAGIGGTIGGDVSGIATESTLSEIKEAVQRLTLQDGDSTPAGAKGGSADSSNQNSLSIDEDSLKRVLGDVTYKVQIQDDTNDTSDEDNKIIELLNSLVVDNKNERGAFLNTKTGSYTGLVHGDAHSIITSTKDWEDAAKQGYDARIHYHTKKVAAPSGDNSDGKGSDFHTWVKAWENNIKKQLIVTQNEILAFDFSGMTKEQLETIRDAYEQEIIKIKAGSADDESWQVLARQYLEKIMRPYVGAMKSYEFPNAVSGTLREKTGATSTQTANASIDVNELNVAFESATNDLAKDQTINNAKDAINSAISGGTATADQKVDKATQQQIKQETGNQEQRFERLNDIASNYEDIDDIEAAIKQFGEVYKQIVLMSDEGYKYIKPNKTGINTLSKIASGDFDVSDYSGVEFQRIDKPATVTTNIALDATEITNAIKESAVDTSDLTKEETLQSVNGLIEKLGAENENKTAINGTVNVVSPADGNQIAQEGTLQQILVEMQKPVTEDDGNQPEQEVEQNEGQKMRTAIMQELAKHGTYEAAHAAGRNKITYDGQEVQFARLVSDYMKNYLGTSFSPDGFRNLWEDAREQFYKFEPIELTKEDAINIIREKVPDNILEGWFRKGDSEYKTKLESITMSDDEIRNAALNIMWSNFKEYSGKDIGFNEFLNSETPVYRGKNSENYVNGDDLLAFSFDENMAKKFGQHILKTLIKPIDTLGAFQTTAEAETLVYRKQLEGRAEYQQWHANMDDVDNINKINDLESVYNSASDAAKKLIDQIFMSYHQADSLNKKTSGSIMDNFDKHNVTEEQKGYILETLNEYKRTIKEISEMPIVETEDDEKKLTSLKEEAARLCNTLRQTYLNDAVAKDYAHDYGLSLDNARELRAICDYRGNGYGSDWEKELYQSNEQKRYSLQNELLNLKNAGDSSVTAWYDAVATGDSEQWNALSQKIVSRLAAEAEARKQNATSVAEENAALLEQHRIENSDNAQATISEERAAAAATEARTNAQRELNAAIASEPDATPATEDIPVTSTALVPTNVNESAETRDMTTLLSAVQAVTEAVKLKTRAFWTEKTAVDQAVAGEVAALDELETKLTNIKLTLEGLLSNIRSGESDLAAGLSNINVTVNNPENSTVGLDDGAIDRLVGAINGIKPVQDGASGKTTAVGSVLATENTLLLIKTAVESINKKTVQGTKLGGGSKGSGSKRTTKSDYTGSPFFAEKLKTREMELAKFAQQLMNAGRDTSEMEDAIKRLRNLLKQVNSGASLSVWDQLFKQTKLKDNLGKLKDEPDLKNQLDYYKQLVDIAKRYYKLVEKYEKAADGSERKNTLGQQKSDVEAFFQQMGINLDTLELDDDGYNKKLSDARARHKSNMQEIEAAKFDKELATETAAAEKKKTEELKKQEKIVAHINDLHKQLGELQALSENSSDDMRAYYDEKIRDLEAQIAAEQKKDTSLVPAYQKVPTYDKTRTDAKSAAEDKILFSMLKAEDDKKQADIRKLVKTYEDLAKQRAIYEKTGDLSAEHEADRLRGIIASEQQRLGITHEQIDALRRREEIIFEEHKASLDAEQRESDRKHYIKEEEKSQRAALRKQVSQSRAQARVGQAKTTINRADDLIYDASVIEGVDASEIVDVQTLNKELGNLRNMYNAIQTSDGPIDQKDQEALVNQTRRVKAHAAEVKKMLQQYEALSGENVIKVADFNVGGGGLEKQLTNAAKAAHNGKAKVKEFNAATGELTVSVKTGKNTFTEYTYAVREYDGAIVQAQGSTKKAEGFFESIGRKIKEVFTYFSGSSLIYRFFGEVRRGIQYVREIDLAMTELKKVTNETEESYEKFMNTAAKTADKVGSTMQEIISSTADWSRLGFSMEDAARLAESTSVLLNVSEFQSIDEATNALTSTMQAFGYTADQSMSVVDVMNQIGNNFAVSSDGIATALQDSASALMTANNSYEEAVSLIAAANRVVQNPSEVGGALRTISLRLRGTSVSELEEMGEDTTGAVGTKSKLRSKIKGLTGIDILTDTGAYKSTYQILLEISKVWNDLTDENRAGALELIAGKNRANVASALLTNTKDLEEAYKSALDAEGSAYAENEKYLNSIQGRIDQFTNAVQTMWNNTLDADVIKGFVQLGTLLVQLIDGPLGMLPSILVAIPSIKFGSWLLKTTQESKTLADALKSLLLPMVKIGGSDGKTLGEFFTQTVDGFDGASNGARKFSSVLKATGKTIGKFFTTTAGKAALTTVAITAVVVIARKMIVTLNDAKEYFTDTIDKLDETTNELNEAKQNLEDIKKRIDDIIKGGTLTFTDKEELERLKAQSAELQRQIDLKTELQKQQQQEVNEQALKMVEQHKNVVFDNGKSKGEYQETGATIGAIASGAGVAIAGAIGGAKAAAAIGTAIGTTIAPGVGSAIGAALGAIVGAVGGALAGSAVGGAIADTKEQVGESIDDMRDKYAELQNDYNKARSAYMKNPGDKDAAEEYEKAEEALSKYKSAMSGYLSELDSYYSSIDLSVYDPVKDKEKIDELRQEINDFYDEQDKYAILSGGAGAKSNALARIFGENANEDIKAAKQEIETAMKSDGAENFDFFKLFDDDKFESFKNRLYDLGLSITDVEYYFKDLAIVEQEAAKTFDAYDTIKQLNAVSDGVGSLKDAFAEFDEQGLVTAKTLESLHENFGHLGDAWVNYINSMSSATTSTEQAERATKELAEAFVNDKISDGPIKDLKEYAILLTQLSSMGFANPKEYLDAKQKASMTSDIAKAVVGDEEWNGQLNDDVINQYIADYQKEYGITLDSTEDRLLVEKAITAEKAKQNVELATEKAGAAQALEIAKKRLEEEKGRIEYEYKPISEVGTNVSDVPNVDVWSYTDANGEHHQSFTGDEMVVVKVNNAEFIKSYEDAVEEAQTKYDSIEVPAGINIDNAEEEAQKAKDEYQRALDDQGLTIALELKNFDNDIDEIQSSYSTLSDVVKEYNKNKFLSLDNLQALLNLEPEYLACLQMENGQLSINQAAMEAMVQAKLAEAKATVVQKAITELNTLAQRKEADATVDSANAAGNAIGNLGAYADMLGIVAQEAIVAAGSVAAFNSAVAGAEANELVSQEEIDTVLSNMETQLAMIDSVSTNLSANFGKIVSPDTKSGSDDDDEDALDKLKKKYERQLAMLDAQKQYLENEISRLEAENKPVSKSLYEEQIKIEEKKLKLYEQERAELLATMNTVPKHSDDWWEMAEAVWDVEHAIQESTLSIVEMKDAITQLYIDAFDDVGGAHDNKLTFLDDQKQYIEDYKNYLETLGIEVPEEMYTKLIGTEEQKRAQNEAKLKNLEAQFLEAKKNGLSATDEEWVRMSADIRQVESAILASTVAMKEYEKEMREAEWGKFDELMKRIKDVESEMEHMASLFEDDKVANEDGTWTKEGATQLGLLYQKMMSAESAVEEYNKQIEDLKEEYETTEMAESVYYERLKELEELRWDEVESIEAQKDAIVDLHEQRVEEVRNGIEEEIDAYNELIKVKQDALSAERDLHDFRKNIQDQTKDIATLERKIASMSGSTDAATVAERTRLEAELKEAQESLNDSYYDHSMDAQSNALDEEGEAFEKSKNDYIEQLEQTLENAQFLIDGTMYDVLANADIVLSTIKDKAAEYGIPLSENLLNPWEKAADQATSFKDTADADVRALINEEGVVCIFNSEANRLISEVFNSGKGLADQFNTDVTTILSSMYGEGGSVTVFSSTAAQKFQSAFGAGNTAATKFKNHVAGQIDLIRADINSENPLLTKYLKQPWTDGQNAANTFSTQTGRVLDALVNKANSTAKDIGTYADGIIADMKAAQRAIDETGGKSSGGGDIDGDDTPPATKTIKGYNATATWNNGPAKIAAQGSGKTKKDAEQNALNKLGTAYMKVKTAGGASELHVQKAWQDILKYQKYKITSTPYYAKGTTGTKKDQWAITDEPQYGDELVLIPGKDGNLSYMRKGTSVIPADISENLMKLGMNPNFANMSNGIKGINIMTNYVNKPELKLDIENFLHVDNVSQDTMPELKKFVKEQVNSMVKQLNYGLKRN